MTSSAKFAVGMALAGIMVHSLALAQAAFHTRLDTVPIDFRTQAATTGNGIVEATLVGGELMVSGTFEGLASPATEAWLHVGAAVGARGPSAHELTVSHAAAGEVSGSVHLSRREIEALQAGRLYVQIHSQSAPEGNLWGWLMSEDELR